MPEPQITVELTADALCRALYGEGVESINRGFYKGTKIRLRQVPADAHVLVHAWSGGGRVEDSDGGWIADRFGPGLGHREAQKAVRALSR
jgi:hypothetical protein